MNRMLHRVRRRLGSIRKKPTRTGTLSAEQLEWHGSNYGGWSILNASLSPASVVYSFGIGEEISFDRSLIHHYGCTVHGFDPTPRAIEFVKQQSLPQLVMHEYGLGARTGTATFYLPRNPKHVSGAIVSAPHLKNEGIRVPLKCLADIFTELGHDHVDVLKMDIEGAEYEVIDSLEQDEAASKISQWLIEFHDRFDGRGASATDRAIQQLQGMGFELAWVSPREWEFLFTRLRA